MVTIKKTDWQGTQELFTTARTNLVKYSEDLSNAYWTAGQSGDGIAAVVTPNDTTAPDGTVTADLIEFDLGGGTTSGDTSSVVSDDVVFADGTYIFSFWIKSATASNQEVQAIMVADSSTSAIITATPVFTRQWVVLNTAAKLTGGYVGWQLKGDVSTADTASFHIWGAQVELVS